MQGDEAGEEGSGSGRNYPDDDAAYDAEGSGEEGSGDADSGNFSFTSVFNCWVFLLFWFFLEPCE